MYMKTWEFKWDDIYNVDPTEKCKLLEGTVKVNPKYPLKDGQIGRFRTGYYTSIDGIIHGIIISTEFQQYLETTKTSIKIKITEKTPTVIDKSYKITKANVIINGKSHPIETPKSFNDEKTMNKVFSAMCIQNKILYKDESRDVTTRVAIIKKRHASFEFEVNKKTLVSSDLKEIKRWLRSFYLDGKTRKPRLQKEKEIVPVTTTTKSTKRSERPAVKKDIAYCRTVRGDGSVPTAFEQYCMDIEVIEKDHKK